MLKICVPFYSEYEQTKEGMRQLIEMKYPFEVIRCQSANIARSRNALVNGLSSNLLKQTLEAKYDTFLFIDSDIGFTAKQAIYAAEQQYPIFSLPYLKHKIVPQYEQGMFVEGVPGKISHFFTPEEKGIREIDFSGAGFLAIKKYVFEKMDFPWFRFGIYQEDDWAEQVGEDQQFCIDAKKAGFTVMCDFSNPVYHRKRNVTHNTN